MSALQPIGPTIAAYMATLTHNRKDDRNGSRRRTADQHHGNHH